MAAIPCAKGPDGRRNRRTGAIAAIGFWAACAAFHWVDAQETPRDAILDFLSGRGGEEASAEAAIESRPDISHLLEQAEDAIGRQDWKLAIDSLQRVVEQGDRALMPVHTSAASPALGVKPPEQLYEPAVRAALKRLASLPREGREAYQLLYGGAARRWVEEGVAGRNPHLLRRVVREFPLTASASKAFDSLSAWLLDEGSAREVLSLTAEYAEWFPAEGRSVPVLARRAAALAMMGRQSEARAILQEALATSKGESPESPAWLAALEKEVTAGSLALGEAPSREASIESLSSNFPEVGGPATGAAPWSYSLSPAAPRRWAYVEMAGAAWELSLPLAPNFAWDDRALYVRTPEGCVALDLQRLKPLWSWSGAPPVIDSLSTPGAYSSRSILSRWMAATCADYLSSGVTVGAGKVFVIERHPEWKTPDYILLRLRFGRMFDEMEPPSLMDLLGGPPTRLSALDAASGAPVWQLDSTTEPSGPFHEARFLGAPLCMNGEAWFIYAQGHDLFVGMVDAERGDLLDRVHLCSVGSLEAGAGAALQLATDGLRVYAPTGHGLLFALDARDHALQWAARYNDGSDYSVWARRGEQLSGKLGWIPSAPVVAGGRVLLAPHDYHQLLVHETRTGAVLWRAETGEHSYILAADEECVWLGGRRLTCLAMADGAVRWSVDIAGLAAHESRPGRAVRCGDEIVLPTTDGVIRLSAKTGEVLQRRVLAGLDAPLGLLFAANHGLFSVDPDRVRAFPDVEQAYPEALARHDKSPRDAGSGLRLAWLEHLQGNSGRAIELLDEIEGGGEGKTQADEIAPLRVAAQMRLCADATDKEARLSHAEAALAAASSAGERLDAGLLVAQATAESGDGVAAAKSLWTLASLAGAGTLEDADVRRLRLVRDECNRIIRDLNEGRRRQVREWAEARIDQVVRKGTAQEPQDTEAALLSVARMNAPAAGSAAAWLALGKLYAEQQRLESAEIAYQSAVRISDRPAQSIEALLRLEALYGPTLLNQPFLSADARRELSARFKSVALPPAFEDEQHGIRNVEDWLARRQPPPPWRGLDKLPIGGAIRLTREQAPGVRGSAEEYRPMDMGARPGASCWEDVVFLSEGRRLVSRRVENGAVNWSCDLRLSGDWQEPRRDEDDSALWLTRRGILQGSSVFMVNRSGLHGVGVRTGKRVWSRAYDLSPTAIGEWSQDWRYFAAGDHGIVFMPAWSVVAMLDPLDGSTVWETDLPTLPITSVRCVGDRVLAGELGFGGVYVLEASTGRRLARAHFQTQEVDERRESRGVPVVAVERIIGIAADDEHGLIAYHLADGSVAWRLSLENAPLALFEAGQDRIGVGFRGGRVVLVDASTGAVALDTALPDTGGVFDGLLVGDVLLVQHGRTPSEDQPPVLAAVNSASGSVLWRREDVFLPEIPRDVWRECAGRLPVLFEVEDAKARQFNPVMATVLDAQTGRSVGPTLPFLETDARDRPLGEMSLCPGRLLINTMAGVRVFEVATGEAK
ncbi:MAG: PQQ-binding-like beta-propeller repeat protein [Phycisphaerales bacterium]|nr:PQQ-binding-like beta-propeller repeat protein [Phycisphaerales bacterium]